jgi:phosphomannomutase/phosphoglucomutase
MRCAQSRHSRRRAGRAGSWVRSPTPLLYYATHTLGSSHAGVMVTGSHNPPQYNGLKIVIDKIALHGEVIRDLRRRIETGDLAPRSGWRAFRQISASITSAGSAPPCPALTVQGRVDCGNAIAAKTAPPLLRALGCEVVELYCEVDGRFPTTIPTPAFRRIWPICRRRFGASGRYRPGFRRRRRPAGRGHGRRRNHLAGSGIDAASRRGAGPLHPGAAVVYDIKCSWHLTR